MEELEKNNIIDDINTIPSIEITESEKPIKFVPISPINVLAGLKLNGKNPAKAPTKAVIIIIAINGDPFNAKIINKQIHEIIEIPDDNPSNPSIKFIALVIPTIQNIVNVIEKIFPSTIFPSRKGSVKLFILIPHATTITAPISCPKSLTYGLIPFISSK